jgi:hypothetical protein
MSGVPKPEAEDIEVEVEEGKTTYRAGFAPLDGSGEPSAHRGPEEASIATPSGDPFSAHALSEYAHAAQNEFPPYEKLVKGKRQMYAFTDEELNAIGRMLPHELNTMTAFDKAGIAARILLRFGTRAFDVRDALDTFGYSVGEKYGW